MIKKQEEILLGSKTLGTKCIKLHFVHVGKLLGHM